MFPANSDILIQSVSNTLTYLNYTAIADVNLQAYRYRFNASVMGDY